MTVLWIIVVVVVLGVLPYLRWTGCDCGRERVPWFYRRHEKQWLMWVLTVTVALVAISAALAGTTWAIALNGVVFVLHLRGAWEHGKGKMRWPRRAVGVVRIVRHGRLSVVNELSASHAVARVHDSPPGVG